jgi:hypothetical protein
VHEKHFVVAQLNSRIMPIQRGGSCSRSVWDGPTETALYAYGASFKEMSERLAGFAATYPLCERCRIVQIA